MKWLPLAIATLMVATGVASAQDCDLASHRCVGPGQEYSSIQAAADVVVAGDTVWVFDGDYEPFDVDRSGTASNPIVFRSVNRHGARITASKSAHGHRAAIMVFLADYVTIDGFKVDLRGTSGPGDERAIACYGWDPFQKGCVVRNNWTAGGGKSNIFSAYSEGIVIENNITLEAELTHGIYVSNSADNPVIRGNIAYDNQGAGIQINADKFSPPGDGIITGAIIESNLIYGNSQNCSAALSLDGIRDSVIRNNLLYDNGCQSITVTCVDGGKGPRNIEVVNNTVIVPSGAPSSNWAIKIEGNSGRSDCPDEGGHSIFNNILLDHGGSSGALSIENSDVSSNHNRLSNRLRRNGSRVDLATWKSWGYDGESLVDSPDNLFADPGGDDYHLANGSSAVDAGVASFAGVTAPAVDLDGVTRPRGGAHDIGAFERPDSGGGDPPPAPENLRRTDKK